MFSRLILLIRDCDITWRGGSNFNALSRCAGPFRCDRESIPEKMQKPGQDTSVYALIFFF